MHPDRLKWNRKHHLAGPGLQPAEAVARYVHLARSGRALDIMTLTAKLRYESFSSSSMSRLSILSFRGCIPRSMLH